MRKIVTYKARMEFKYGGKIIKKGEEWKPAGGKYDKKIIEDGRYVIRYEHNITRKKPIKKVVAA